MYQRYSDNTPTSMLRKRGISECLQLFTECADTVGEVGCSAPSTTRMLIWEALGWVKTSLPGPGIP